MYTCSNVELRITSAIVASLGIVILYQATSVDYISNLIIMLFAWIAIKEWSLFFPVRSWCYWLYGCLYFIPPCIALIQLNQSETARFLLPLMCLLNFSSDGGAYMFGKLWGKKKLCPTISPNKTWMGLAGAYIITYAVLVAYQRPTTIHSLLPLFVLSMSTTTLAVAGDLFESWLKRRVGLKDSGSFLPGHGGALDRIDSLIPVSVFFYITQTWILSLLKS